MKHIPEELSQEDGRWLKALFEVATDGIIKINSRGIIENVNLAACTLFGYEELEMLGKKVNVLMNSHDRTHHDEYLEGYERTRAPKIIGIGREVVGRRKNGEAFPLRLAVSEVKFDGRVVYAGMLHDLSDFKKAQEGNTA